MAKRSDVLNVGHRGKALAATRVVLVRSDATSLPGIPPIRES